MKAKKQLLQVFLSRAGHSLPTFISHALVENMAANASSPPNRDFADCSSKAIFDLIDGAVD